MATGDGLYRRPLSPFWYFKVKVDGRWKEVSTKQKNFAAAKKTRSQWLQTFEKNGDSAVSDARLFAAAIDGYLERARLRLKESSVRKEAFFLARPRKALGGLKCEQISIQHLENLQRKMKAEGLQNSYINLVLGAVSGVLRSEKVWKRLADDFRRLPERAKPIARVLTSEQKSILFQVAETNPSWVVAFSAALLAANTGMRGCELKGLQWCDVNFDLREVEIGESKTDAGIRTVYLNDQAFYAMEMLMARAVKLNCDRPAHFVLP